ncbi:unnamed protein product [Enterobius vermicularis]|uniref:WASH complex subunit 7 n=1 Tax=Enterobius vermicularis TaxID=51028 RepID=A0A0N4V7C9_ENTVE|nr:unnamed protein product [Enterobius vermicularis]
MTFSSLVLETNRLQDIAWTEVYPALLLYGEDVDGQLASEGGSVKMMANFLPFLQEVYVFVNRCYEVFRNAILQMYNFYLIREDVLERTRQRAMLRMWRAVGGLLSVFIFLDEIIRSHPLILSHWSFFVKSMQSVLHNPSLFNADSPLLKPLSNVVQQIGSMIMDGFIFKNCCQQPFQAALHADLSFCEHIRNIILSMYTRWERVASDDIADKRLLSSIIALATFHSHLFRTVDKKLFKMIWHSNNRLATFHVIGDIVWTPCDFLIKNVSELEKAIDKKSLSFVGEFRSVPVAQKTALLAQEMTTTANLLTEWIFKMEEELRNWPIENVHGHLKQRIILFLEGMRQADLLSRTVKLVLCGTLNEKKPLSRSVAMDCLRFIQLIKAYPLDHHFCYGTRNDNFFLEDTFKNIFCDEVESTFIKWWNEVFECIQQGLQHWSGQLLRLVNNARESLRSEAVLSNDKVDIISSLTIAGLSLSGSNITILHLFSVSSIRMTVAGIALDFVQYAKIFRSEELETANDLICRMETFLKFQQTLARLCSCSFLFWHRSLISTYFDSLINESVQYVEYFFAAVTDVETLLNACRHVDPGNLKKKFCSEIFDDFEKKFLMKLCEAVETDLRLSMHSYLQPVEAKLAKGPVQEKSFHLKRLLDLPPLFLCGQFFDVKRYTELHLERAFYNLTAVALHDCHTYVEMRLLAFEKYGLHLCESHLPFQTLDQGSDMLLITRNLHLFVSNYNYNLNGQFFIEKDSRNKHLNILSVEHVANSVRTHGTGIMNTVINFAYQYLKKRFFVFSQFLYDDHIKGQLIKEIRYFQSNADQLNKMYPMKRVQRFNSRIRRLGVTDEGLSFLDKFRILITNIGNVMGYVRLVRSGSIEASSHSLAFLRDPDDVVSFASLATDSSFSAETVEAAKFLDEVLEETAKSVNQSNNYLQAGIFYLHYGVFYLQILVEVFSKELRNFEKYEHLRNFYVIVPSLTVNYVESILNCKGTLGRRSQQNSSFTDDGFVLGIAFILTTLDQIGKFESLNWFASVEKRCEDESVVAKTPRNLGSRLELEPSVKIRIAKLEHYQKVLFS